MPVSVPPASLKGDLVVVSFPDTPTIITGIFSVVEVKGQEPASGMAVEDDSVGFGCKRQTTRRWSGVMFGTALITHQLSLMVLTTLT